MIPPKYRYETIVGFFVVISLAALFIMVLIIARQEGLFQEYVEYQATYKNVSGLKPGDEVHLAGVTVGNVKSIVIEPAGNTRVTFKVVKKYSDRIREDSQASIGFVGLLGEKSLELTAGSPSKPRIPPGGPVASIEPLDITQFLAKAGPGMENLQKILSNLAELTGTLVGKKGSLVQTFDQLRDIFTKINNGQGTLGQVVNNPKLYQETTATISAARQVFTNVGQGKGALGALINDPKFRGQMERAMGNFQEGTARLPEISKKMDKFMNHLNKAGKALPDLVTSGDTMVGDADKVAKAAQKTWLLKRHVPQPQEHTINMDAQVEKD